jgi:predicted CoA-substrate-specific enzyme activase
MKTYLTGIDVGSTTVKIAVVDSETEEVLHSSYKRHNAEQIKTTLEMLEEAHNLFPDAEFNPAVCGSGGQAIAEMIGAHFIQEVVANSVAVRKFYSESRVAIELGGQDAKVIFFHEEEGQLVASDMRMNGSCAGGTGAFLDQVAELLHLNIEEFNEYAERGGNVYDISGRCGVFAKTDIQPLLNQGVSKEDIALSSFHALAKQTIGGLAQGMDITPKIIFEGGPLNFNPRLIEVFKERLAVGDDDIIIPENPEILVAYGAALSIPPMFTGNNYHRDSSLKALRERVLNKQVSSDNGELFFKTEEEETDFHKRHPKFDFTPVEPPRGGSVNAYIGIDAGSTTSKFVLINEEGTMIDSFYGNNKGMPLDVVKEALLDIRNKYRDAECALNILGVGTTGYGEQLFARAFKADYHTVETVAHVRAARDIAPDVSFIMDIGGQDMKAITIKNGIVSEIVLNEACSAGCGSFVETYAKSLGIPVENIAEQAFQSKHPSILGSRCTVFMNSSIITEQKNGKTTEDILAGICTSIIENVFTKVVRVRNFDQLGGKVVLQGGTFKNDAVLRAFELYTGREVVRAPHPGEMGALGIAQLTKDRLTDKRAVLEEKGQVYNSPFIGLDSLDKFTYDKKPGQICTFCSNNCNRTVVTFSDGSHYITGNRCEKGQILGDTHDPAIKSQLKSAVSKMERIPDMMTLQNTLLFNNYVEKSILPKQNITIGIPRTLEFWSTMPFWSTLFRTLGFDVTVSKRSNYELFEQGLKFIPSDTICFPAKLAHGHMEDLLSRGVDRIFMPKLINLPQENDTAETNFNCVVVQGYPLVLEQSNEPTTKHNVPFDHPIFHWYNEKIKANQLVEFFGETFSLKESDVRKAVEMANGAQSTYYGKMRREGQNVLDALEGSNDFAVVLAGRPYHTDQLVNHNLANHFTKQGIAVLTLDSLPMLHDADLNDTRMDTTIVFHNRMAEAALSVRNHPNLELVQIVSFGCGHDAIISDEMVRILRDGSDKEMLILKMDEGDAVGPLNIRIKSFVETVKSRREKEEPTIREAIGGKINEIRDHFPIKYNKKDRKTKTILAPNLSPAFSLIMSEVLSASGMKMKPLPPADKRAKELGKKYVHNDICFPAQINVGECLAVLERGEENPDEIALGLAKNCEACRAGQYAGLARKALDEAGYPQIPIVTTGSDSKDMHPGFSLTLIHQIHILWGMTLTDGMERMRRRLRPYELEKGETDRIFDKYVKKIATAIPKSHSKALKIFRKAVEEFNTVKVDISNPRPRVAIVGEILMNYHPTANGELEPYLEANGMEVILPAMHDFFRKNPLIDKEIGRRKWSPAPISTYLINDITGKIFDRVRLKVQKELDNFTYIDPHTSIFDMVKNTEDLIDVTYVGGEGWKIPGEIIQMIKHGVNAFVIVQPFGCIPNHITGRGMTKTLKKMYPKAQIISLDYDPDTSFANVENRLQMLIMTTKEIHRQEQEKQRA